MARRKAGLNPSAVSKVVSQMGEPLSNPKGPASEIAGRVASGETAPIPGFNMNAAPAQGGSQPSPNAPSGGASGQSTVPNGQSTAQSKPAGPPVRPGYREPQRRPSRFPNEASTPTSTPSTTTSTPSTPAANQGYTPLTGPQREQRIREEMARSGAVRRGPVEAQIDAQLEQERISALPPPPILPPPPAPGFFGKTANFMQNNADALPALATIGKSLITGRRVSPNPNSEEARRVKGVSGMVQTSPIMTSNTFLYKNYPGMPQGGANQQQAPNGYTKNSVNGQTGPLPQVTPPNTGNPGQINMATPPMPASGAGQSAPRSGGLPSVHSQQTAGVGGNPYLGPDAQHGTMTAPTVGPAQPIRAPRQVTS